MGKIIDAAFILSVAAVVAGFVYVRSPSGSAQVQHLAYKVGLSDRVLCINIPNEPIAFDTLDEDALKRWNSTVRYAINPQNLSVLDTPEGGALRQRFVPSEKGSERVVWVVDIDGRPTYELKQRFLFEEGFDWGGISESGKFGFGFAGGSAPTGGTTDKDGFTARLAWLGNSEGRTSATVYLYSADRTQNLPYGDEIEIPGFAIPVGEWVDITIRVTVNSEIDKADGDISVLVNDELLLERKNIQWQSEGEKPIIDRLLYSSFHGGNTPDWTPDNVVHAQFSNACLYD